MMIAVEQGILKYQTNTNMPVDLKFEIEGEKEMSRKLMILSKDIKDLRPEFEKGTNFLKEFFGGEAFESRGALLGEPWPPRKKFYPWPPLERSGRMRRSFDTEVGNLQGAVFNAVDYFKYHQSKMPRRKLPRRIMMKLTNQLKDKIVSIFHEGIYNRIIKAR